MSSDAVASSSNIQQNLARDVGQHAQLLGAAADERGQPRKIALGKRERLAVGELEIGKAPQLRHPRCQKLHTRLDFDPALTRLAR